METSRKSQLPFYEVGDVYKTNVGVGDEEQERRVAEIKCPRRDCGRIFIVVVSQWWSRKIKFIGRSCPYCFKASRIPKRPRS